MLARWIAMRFCLDICCSYIINFNEQCFFSYDTLSECSELSPNGQRTLDGASQGALCYSIKNSRIWILILIPPKILSLVPCVQAYPYKTFHKIHIFSITIMFFIFKRSITAMPFKDNNGRSEFTHSYGINECDHRFWPIPWSLSYQ